MDGTFAQVIAGQIARHGSAYSALEADIMRARIDANARDIAARQSLAEALTRLGNHEEALAELDKIDDAVAGRFETWYQRALIHDAMGDLDGALASAQKAISLRPSGHDEMGDYFLRMYQWKKSRGSGDSAARDNFLGVPYADGSRAVAAAPDVSQPRLMGLLETFPEFRDGYLVLGDWLAANDREQLAVRAYLRAISLAPGEVTNPVLAGRLKAIEDDWAKEAENSKEMVFDEDYRERVNEEFSDAAKWAAFFQTVERDLAGMLPAVPPNAAEDAEPAAKTKAEEARRKALLSLRLPSKDQVLAELTRRGIKPPAYFHVGLVKAAESRWTAITSISPIIWALLGVALAVFYLAYRFALKDRWSRRYRL